MIPKLLKAEEVAELLDVSVQRVYKLTREGQLPTVKLGDRQYRYDPRALDAFFSPAEHAAEEEVVTTDG